MMRVFPSQPRLAAGFRFQLAKHNHMVMLCSFDPEGSSSRQWRQMLPPKMKAKDMKSSLANSVPQVGQCEILILKHLPSYQP